MVSFPSLEKTSIVGSLMHLKSSNPLITKIAENALKLWISAFVSLGIGLYFAILHYRKLTQIEACETTVKHFSPISKERENRINDLKNQKSYLQIQEEAFESKKLNLQDINNDITRKKQEIENTLDSLDKDSLLSNVVKGKDLKFNTSPINQVSEEIFYKNLNEEKHLLKYLFKKNFEEILTIGSKGLLKHDSKEEFWIPKGVLPEKIEKVGKTKNAYQVIFTLIALDTLLAAEEKKINGIPGFEIAINEEVRCCLHPRQEIYYMGSDLIPRSLKLNHQEFLPIELLQKGKELLKELGDEEQALLHLALLLPLIDSQSARYEALLQNFNDLDKAKFTTLQNLQTTILKPLAETLSQHSIVKSFIDGDSITFEGLSQVEIGNEDPEWQLNPDYLTEEFIESLKPQEEFFNSLWSRFDASCLTFQFDETFANLDKAKGFDQVKQQYYNTHTMIGSHGCLFSAISQCLYNPKGSLALSEYPKEIKKGIVKYLNQHGDKYKEEINEQWQVSVEKYVEGLCTLGKIKDSSSFGTLELEIISQVLGLKISLFTKGCAVKFHGKLLMPRQTFNPHKETGIVLFLNINSTFFSLFPRIKQNEDNKDILTAWSKLDNQWKSY